MTNCLDIPYPRGKNDHIVEVHNSRRIDSLTKGSIPRQFKGISENVQIYRKFAVQVKEEHDR